MGASNYICIKCGGKPSPDCNPDYPLCRAHHTITPSGYQVEILCGVGEGEWEREECVYGVKRVAIQDARRTVKPSGETPFGESRTGARVVDNRTNKVVWDNTRSEVK